MQSGYTQAPLLDGYHVQDHDHAMDIMVSPSPETNKHEVSTLADKNVIVISFG